MKRRRTVITTELDETPSEFRYAQEIVPATKNCIVCDGTEHDDDKRRIVVFEFPGFGLECFTFPDNRKSVWEAQAHKFVALGGVPRFLCGACHHVPRSTPHITAGFAISSHPPTA